MICTACRAALRTARASPVRALALGACRSSASSASLLSAAARPAPSPSPTRSFSASHALHARSVVDLEEPPSMTPAESAIADVLVDKLAPTQLLVQDVSGGCGSMYAIDITSPAFRGQSILKQQRMVNAALGDLVKGWHGVQIRTKVPPADDA